MVIAVDLLRAFVLVAARGAELVLGNLAASDPTVLAPSEARVLRER